jgi:thiol-disulfide isomerase/thioredoxin
MLAGVAVALVAAGGGVLANHWSNRDTDVAYAAQAGAQSGSASGSQPDTHASPVQQLWAAPVTNVNGKPQSLSLLKGHPIVVNFWASWCGPCVEEMPALSQIQREYAKKGIEFVGLGVDSEKNIQTFLQKVKVAYPIYVTGFGGACRRSASTTRPTTSAISSTPWACRRRSWWGCRKAAFSPCAPRSRTRTRWSA